MTQTGSSKLDPVFCCHASGTAGQLSGVWGRPLADPEASRSPWSWLAACVDLPCLPVAQPGSEVRKSGGAALCVWSVQTTAFCACFDAPQKKSLYI